MATTRSLSGLWDRSTGEFDSSPALREGVIDNFHRLYYSDDSTWRNLTYRGVTTWKCPLDLWIYQEIIHELHPDLIIETGTAYGGSALYLADLCDLSGSGEVVTIDITDRGGRGVSSQADQSHWVLSRPSGTRSGGGRQAGRSNRDGHSRFRPH